MNPCSRTAPCKTFAGAISKTAAGGEIDTLDPGGFGAVTITKAITIDGAGTLGSILASASQSGIIVNAGVNDIVTIRNLTINGGTPTLKGLHGIRWIAGKTLRVENCEIFGFSSRGISAEATGGGNLFVLETVIRDVGNYGILTEPSSGTTGIKSVLDRVSINASANGIYFGDGSKASVRNSNISRNTGVGIQSAQIGTATEVMIDNTTIMYNDTGIVAGGGVTETRLSNVTLMNNTTNGFNYAGGSVVSFSNNRIRNNGGSNVPTTTIGQN